MRPDNFGNRRPTNGPRRRFRGCRRRRPSPNPGTARPMIRRAERSSDRRRSADSVSRRRRHPRRRLDGFRRRLPGRSNVPFHRHRRIGRTENLDRVPSIRPVIGRPTGQSRPRPLRFRWPRSSGPDHSRARGPTSDQVTPTARAVRDPSSPRRSTNVRAEATDRATETAPPIAADHRSTHRDQPNKTAAAPFGDTTPANRSARRPVAARSLPKGLRPPSGRAATETGRAATEAGRAGKHDAGHRRRARPRRNADRQRRSTGRRPRINGREIQTRMPDATATPHCQRLGKPGNGDSARAARSGRRVGSRCTARIG